jgi:hypothetical protein
LLASIPACFVFWRRYAPFEREWRGEKDITIFIFKRVVFTKSVAVNDVIVIYQPGIDGDEVGDKTGNAALEHGAIPADDVLQVDVCLVCLVHHYVSFFQTESDWSKNKFIKKLIGHNFSAFFTLEIPIDRTYLIL